MPKKTILEALTRIVLQARPRATCCSKWRNAGQIIPNLETVDVAYAGSGLQVIARTVSLRQSRQGCAFRGRPSLRNMTTRWFCTVKMSTISRDWVDLS